jgi:hypothetical protein
VVRRFANQTQAADARLKRLAAEIDALAQKDDILHQRGREIEAVRRNAAAAIYAVCGDFVDSLNRLLSRGEVLLDPAEPPSFQEDAPNLIQINIRGRILQVAFTATRELISTEDFRVPYTLSGSIRAFNQALLEKDIIEEQLIFFTVGKREQMWRFFDARTYRSGSFSQEYLISLMEQLL